MRKSWTRRLLASLVWLAAPATGFGYSFGITSTVPAYPVAEEPLVVHLTIPTSSSGLSVFRHSATVVGNVIHVDGCYGGMGFAVPGAYTAAVALPALQAGTYSLEYYSRSSITDAFCPFTTPAYLATFS